MKKNEAFSHTETKNPDYAEHAPHRRHLIKSIPPQELRLVFDDPEKSVSREDFSEKDGSLSARTMLRYIAKNQGANTPRIMQFFLKSEKTISRWTTELRYRGFVKFRGTMSSGGYFLTRAGLEFLENPSAERDFVPVRMTESLVLNFIRKHPGVNHFDIAAKFCRTIKSAARHTKTLRKKGEIEFRGTPREGGFYSINESMRNARAR